MVAFCDIVLVDTYLIDPESLVPTEVVVEGFLFQEMVEVISHFEGVPVNEDFVVRRWTPYIGQSMKFEARLEHLNRERALHRVPRV
jgi:hypothetical protein